MRDKLIHDYFGVDFLTFLKREVGKILKEVA